MFTAPPPVSYGCIGARSPAGALARGACGRPAAYSSPPPRRHRNCWDCARFGLGPSTLGVNNPCRRCADDTPCRILESRGVLSMLQATSTGPRFISSLVSGFPSAPLWYAIASNCCNCLGKLMPPARAIPGLRRHLDGIDLVVDHRRRLREMLPPPRRREVPWRHPWRLPLPRSPVPGAALTTRLTATPRPKSIAEASSPAGKFAPWMDTSRVTPVWQRGRLTRDHRVMAHPGHGDIHADLVIAAGEPSARISRLIAVQEHHFPHAVLVAAFDERPRH